MPQYGFFFDQSRCTSCKTCAVSCKDWNDIPPGPAKWLRTFEWETGVFPNVRLHTLFAPCYHCEDPICVDACPNGALYKESEYGAVLIDKEKCTGTRQCWLACPYGAIVYASDEPGEKAQKCNMCVDKLDQGEQPACVMSCPMRALDFGHLDNLKAKYGTNQQLEGMPSPLISKPSVVFKPMDEPVILFPYDADRALELLSERGSYAPIYDSAEDVTDVPPNLVGRSLLVMKPRDEEELMSYTRNDEG